MTCDLLVLKFSSNVTFVTAIFTTLQSVSIVVTVTVSGIYAEKYTCRAYDNGQSPDIFCPY